eukprot:673180-Rhodomonas_salina.3
MLRFQVGWLASAPLPCSCCAPAKERCQASDDASKYVFGYPAQNLQHLWLQFSSLLSVLSPNPNFRIRVKVSRIPASYRPQNMSFAPAKKQKTDPREQTASASNGLQWQEGESFFPDIDKIDYKGPGHRRCSSVRVKSDVKY